MWNITKPFQWRHSKTLLPYSMRVRLSRFFEIVSQSLNGTWYHIIRVQLLSVHGFEMSHIKLFQPVCIAISISLYHIPLAIFTLHMFLRSLSLGMPFTSIAVFIVSYAHIQWFGFVCKYQLVWRKVSFGTGVCLPFKISFFRAYLIILLKCKMARFSNRRPLFLLYIKVRQ